MMTEREIAEARSQAAALLGRRGGERRAAKLTPKRRSEIARKAAAARWAKPDDDEPTPNSAPGKVISIAAAGRKGGKARAAKMTKAQRNAMCGRHHPALRLIRGGLLSGTDAERKAA